MSERAPGDSLMEFELPGLATDVEDTYVLGEVKEAGSIKEASFTPVAAITGAATNFRRYQLINKGQTGVGTTVMATLDYSAAIVATEFNEDAFTLTATLADRNVVAGDVIAIASLTPGTGIADPGGRVKAVFQRAAS